MFLEGLHEKEIFPKDYPFRLEVNTAKDFYYPMHWHNAVELLYVAEGSCMSTVNNTVYSLVERDILIISGGDIHDFHIRNSNGKRIFIQFDISALGGLGSISIAKPFLALSRKISLIDDMEFHNSLEEQILKIIIEYDKKDFAYSLFLSARIYDILAILARNLAWRQSSQAVQSSIKKIHGLEKLNQAFKFIEENYQNNITLKDVSRASGFSEYHFSRMFKEVTEKNFHTYLKEFRIKKAENLLMNTGISIAEISHAVGFNSIVSFNRTFKCIKGCTPSAFKKMLV